MSDCQIVAFFERVVVILKGELLSSVLTLRDESVSSVKDKSCPKSYEIFNHCDIVAIKKSYYLQ